jgi:hypothetical protein
MNCHYHILVISGNFTSFDAGWDEIVGCLPSCIIYIFHRAMNQKCRVKTPLNFQSQNSALLMTAPQIIPWYKLAWDWVHISTGQDTPSNKFRLPHPWSPCQVAKITPSTYFFITRNLPVSNNQQLIKFNLSKAATKSIKQGVHNLEKWSLVK